MERKIQKDIVYKTINGQALRADVYSPSTSMNAPSPVWFYTHGGGWVGGNREEPLIFPRLMERLSAIGVSVVSIEYRLCGDDVHFPAPVDDCADAVRFFTERAESYGFDPDRAFAGGASAGGHLALLVGLAADKFGDEKASPLARFRGIVDMCGPVDLSQNFNVKERNMVEFFYEKLLSPDREAWPELFSAVSPITYTRALSPESLVPVIAVQGQRDEIVDKAQPELLAKLYKERGAMCEIIRVENGNHGFGQIPGLPAPSPSFDEIQDRIFDFIASYI